MYETIAEGRGEVILVKKGLWPEGYFLRCAYGVGVWLCSQDRDREARGEGFKFPECSHGQKFSRLLISTALAFTKMQRPWINGSPTQGPLHGTEVTLTVSTREQRPRTISNLMTFIR
ncbi:hypothetical protein KQX54_020869 [Cotesia glomerata]|uniref:Uncharacterized protein n=1 Tax=Cotesia glomerata TaxID=32391 RepID=A0AAV7IK33_COTGL|nr:hypothetical protein KQX54_020869 [Cotesia glomerata]